MREIFPLPRVSIGRSSASFPYSLITGTILIGALYVGRDVFVPLALSVLLSFILAPLALWLQRLRLGRVPSVLFVVIVMFAGMFSLFGYLGTQVAELAADLPAYQTTIREKIKTIRGAGAGDGTFGKAGDVLEKLDDELNGNTTGPSERSSNRLTSGPSSR